MSVENLSPLNQKVIETRNQNVQNQPYVDLSSKPDTVEISSKNNKKIGKYLAIGAIGAAILAGGAILACSLVKNGKLLGADKAQKYASKIQSEAEKLSQEVTELFNNGGIKNGNKIANITQGESGVEIMEELASDGSLLRKSTFSDKILSEIELPAKKGSDKFLFKDGKLTGYAKGYEESADGSYKYAKKLVFEDDKLAKYRKGYERSADGSYKFAKDLVFKDGKLAKYTKGFEESADGSRKYAKDLVFIDGKLTEYIKGFEISADGRIKYAKGLNFIDGKLAFYRKGFEESADGSIKLAKSLDFEDGKPISNIIKFIGSYFKKD